MNVEVRQLDAQLATVPILHEIDLTVDDGEMLALVGPNGSGKSTLLRTIYRVVRPHRGHITVGELDVWQSAQRTIAQRIAVLVQEPQGEFDFTTRELVAMGRTPHMGIFDRQSPRDLDFVDHALEITDTAELATRRFRTLSGGEKQRVLLARAIAQQPRVLVLDEPTNHLDIRHQLELLEIVRGLGVTTIAALHDLNLAARYCDRVCVLNAGRVVAHGTPSDVLHEDLVRTVFGVEGTRHHLHGTARPYFSFEPMRRP